MPQLLPERIGLNKLASQAAPPPTDPVIWSELGLEDSGLGTYEGPAGHYTLTLYRVQDSTAALTRLRLASSPDAGFQTHQIGPVCRRNPGAALPRAP